MDKQAREALAEHTVFVRRMDKLRIPLVGIYSKYFIGKEIRPPKVHVGIVKYGDTKTHETVDKWWYKGEDLYRLYDTEQVFTNVEQGNFTYLTPWHIKGRYLPKQKPKTFIDYLNIILMPIIRTLLLKPYFTLQSIASPPAKGVM